MRWDKWGEEVRRHLRWIHPPSYLLLLPTRCHLLPAASAQVVGSHSSARVLLLVEPENIAADLRALLQSNSLHHSNLHPGESRAVLLHQTSGCTRLHHAGPTNTTSWCSSDCTRARDDMVMRTQVAASSGEMVVRGRGDTAGKYTCVAKSQAGSAATSTLMYVEVRISYEGYSLKILSL